MAGRNREDDFNIIKVLEACRDIELMAAKLYEYFADLYKDNAKISVIWEKTSQEECNHAKQFDLAIKLVKHDAIDSLNMCLKDVQKHYNLVEQLYNNAKINPPSLLEAFRMAIQTENLFMKLHMSSIATFSDFSYQGLFNAMMKNDKEHIETLTRTYNDLLTV